MLVCAVLLLLSPTGAYAGDKLAFILFPEKDVYREVADELPRAMRQPGLRIEVIALRVGDSDAQRAALERCRSEKPALLITGGTALTADALRDVPDVPVLFFMVPNAADAPFCDSSSPLRSRVAGVSSDVAPGDQVDWILRSAPRARRVTVLYSDRTPRTAEALQSACRAAGLEGKLFPTSAERITAATDALARDATDGVLMIPDAQVYNAASIQHVLLWGVREKKPVWAFSDKAVKAGAFAGIYADPRSMGRRCAELAQQLLDGKAPAEIGVVNGPNPHRAINQHTAALIGVSPDDACRGGDVEVFGEKP